MFHKMFKKIFIALNSNIKKEFVAAGIACGILLGLIPTGNLLWIAIFLFIFFFKIHFGMMLVTMTIIKLLAPITSSLLDTIGWKILHINSLQEFFTKVYNLPIAPLTNFNNTIVMGGLTAGIVLWIPIFVLFTILIGLYRKKFLPSLKETKLYNSFMKLPGIAKLASSISSFSSKRG